MIQILIKKEIQISTVKYFGVSYRLLKLKDIMKPRHDNSRINILHFFQVMRKVTSNRQVNVLDTNGKCT